MHLFAEATAAAFFVRKRISVAPRVAIVLGSGLGGFAQHVGDPVDIAFAEIPHFPRSTVTGHTGQLVIGTLAGAPVAVMQGRIHGYEGYTPEQTAFPIRVLGLLGIKSLIVTNAAGGIRDDLRQGQFVLLSDHINFTGGSPVHGLNDDRLGPRFFDMSEAYSPRLRKLAQQAAEQENWTLAEGVYLGVPGPSYETPAEIRAFRMLGADLVGMSTVHEVIAARHMGLEVLGLCCVTNLAAGIQKEPISHEEVIETGRRVEERLAGLLTRLVPRMAGEQP